MSGFEAEAEEQLMEAEALESIFVDEFTQISSTPPFHWALKLEPHPVGDGIENHVAVSLEAKLPPAYPNEVPELAVVVLKGLNEAQAESLSAMARKTADENVGMAMLYTIADELKTWLIENNAPPQDDSMFATMQRREKERKAGGAAAARSGSSEEGDGVGAGGGAKKAMTEEEEEAERNRQKILEGTAVTPESFAAWKAAFEAEMSGSAAAEEVSLKPSGRSYFAAGADLEAWEEPDEEVDGAAAVDEGAAAAEGGVDASLFLGEDDLDSDDEDFNDDDEEEDEEEEEDDDDDDDEE